MSFIPTTLYYASAAIHAVSIPGHVLFGIREVDPAIATIPPSEKHALGKATATTAWDMVNALLAASALLNIQWSRVGVRTLEEKAIIWTTVLAGTFTGWRYFKVRSYAGLGCLWVAPWLTAGAMVYEKLGSAPLSRGHPGHLPIGSVVFHRFRAPSAICVLRWKSKYHTGFASEKSGI
ncbi:hypothetical protein LV164_006392 [Aspergillus fumigatus]|nr:hypothetical protein KXW25_006279 [Aspergillus fumigatus]KAH3008601.1 hypothetical protein KXW60_001891 [Aspergillus fumigatus]KAH3142863.1 hypothetical protein KXW18_000459 [Aspergillus fumigatus]KAH3204503.1 hypothetical protein KXW62_006178 [Aspergillus fumigatus]KAH3270792.1 hypothetical protein KXW55_002018 [Aspergillus fumigatus]